MVLGRVTLQSHESIFLRPLNAISLRVRPRSAPTRIGIAEQAVSLLSQPESLVSTSGFVQTAGQSAEESHLAASAPTSMPSGFPSNGSGVFASSAALLLPEQCIVLHSPVESATHSRHSLTASVESEALRFRIRIRFEDDPNIFYQQFKVRQVEQSALTQFIYHKRPCPIFRSSRIFRVDKPCREKAFYLLGPLAHQFLPPSSFGSSFLDPSTLKSDSEPNHSAR